VREPLSVCVYYDFASSLCYVAHRVMERLAGDLADLAVELTWRPLDLTRITGWPRGAPVLGYRRDNALRVARELAVSVRLPTRWMDSRAPNAVAAALVGTEREPAWRERVFSAIHEQGRCLDEAGALEPLARDLGLDLGDLAGPRGSDALEMEIERARAAQVTGVPTFMLGAWPVGGIQEDSVMRSLLGRWAAKTRSRSDDMERNRGGESDGRFG
jgi:predicted DsbA family dithiol-disulfide isomerase